MGDVSATTIIEEVCRLLVIHRSWQYLLRGLRYHRRLQQPHAASGSRRTQFFQLRVGSLLRAATMPPSGKLRQQALRVLLERGLRARRDCWVARPSASYLLLYTALRVRIGVCG